MSDLRTYVTLFDISGFESIIDITSMEETHIVRKLTEEDYTSSGEASALVGRMCMRARFNGHRKSQVWGFQSEIDQKTLTTAAEENPQGMANLIREKGAELFGGYSSSSPSIDL